MHEPREPRLGARASRLLQTISAAQRPPQRSFLEPWWFRWLVYLAGLVVVGLVALFFFSRDPGWWTQSITREEAIAMVRDKIPADGWCGGLKLPTRSYRWSANNDRDAKEWRVLYRGEDERGARDFAADLFFIVDVRSAGHPIWASARVYGSGAESAGCLVRFTR